MERREGGTGEGREGGEREGREGRGKGGREGGREGEEGGKEGETAESTTVNCTLVRLIHVTLLVSSESFSVRD